MCRGSIEAHGTEQAVEGESYIVSRSNHGMGVLHRAGQGPRAKTGIIACAACIREPQKVALTGVPATVRDGYGIGDSVTADFMPSDEVESWDDVIQLEDGRRIDLCEFEGARVTLVTAADTDELPLAA